MPNPDNIQFPILVGGAGRSGTTWAMMNLGRHPAVQGLVETGLAYAIYREIYAAWWSEEFFRKECEANAATRESRTIEAIHQSLSAVFPSRRERWAMKIIWGVESTWGVPLAFWRKCFPGARYIHCTRSPLTAIPSMLGYLGKFSNMSTLGACESAFLNGHRDMLELQSQGLPYFRLRLEDVALDPFASWQALCNFCLLPEATIPAEKLRQPRAARADIAATPRETVAWSDLSAATLEMTARLGYDVPEGCVGRSETPKARETTLAELNNKVAQLAAENNQLQKKLRAMNIRTAIENSQQTAAPE